MGNLKKFSSEVKEGFPFISKWIDKLKKTKLNISDFTKENVDALQVDASTLGGKTKEDFDKYDYFQLKINDVDKKRIGSKNNLNFKTGSGIEMGYSADGGVNVSAESVYNNLTDLLRSFKKLQSQTGTKDIETVSYSTVTNKGAGGIFAGFSIPFGVYKNFQKIRFAVRHTSNSNPFNLKVWITENDQFGAILAEKEAVGDVFGEGFIDVTFDNVITNESSASLCLVYAFDNKALQLRTSDEVIEGAPLIAYTTSTDYLNLSPSDFRNVSAGASATYYGVPYIKITPIAGSDKYFPTDDIVDYILQHSSKTGEVYLNLPSTLYATGGVELNVFYDNIIRTDLPKNSYAINIDCEKGFQFEDRWYWTPQDNNSEIGSYTMNFKIMSFSGDLLIEKDVKIICSSNNSKGQKAITFGDSTTAGGKQNEMISTEHPNEVHFYGILGNSPSNHEGRGGWKFIDYASGTRAENPLYNYATDQLDFANYMASNNYTMDWNDVVHFNLGINDVFGSFADANWTTIKSSIIDLIATIRSYSSGIVIAFNLTIPPSNQQDGFGINYKNGQYQKAYQINNFNLVSKLIAEFDTEVYKNDRVYLIASNASIDTIYGYPFHMSSTSKRAQVLGTEHYYKRINNAVHPSDVGYNQMGDALYSFLKYANDLPLP